MTLRGVFPVHLIHIQILIPCKWQENTRLNDTQVLPNNSRGVSADFSVTQRLLGLYRRYHNEPIRASVQSPRTVFFEPQYSHQQQRVQNP